MARSALMTFLYGGRREAAQTRALPRSRTLLAGRFLLAAIFLMSGLGKLMDWSGTAAYMQGAGIPGSAVPVLLALAIAIEILGGLSIITGTFARAGALVLIVFLIPTTLIFHNFWALEGAERAAQMANFMKNLSIMGGLLLIIGAGAGRLSIDDRIEPKT